MFEYVLHVCTYSPKGKLLESERFEPMVFENLEAALFAQASHRIEYHDRYVYYIEHRIKLDYEV